MTETTPATTAATTRATAAEDAPGVFGRITAESVRSPLQRAVEDPQAMTHSWLFTGPPGSGRSIAAKVFATALVCPHGGCGECDQCRSVAAGTHPDILWVSTTGVVLTVDEIRGAIHEAANMPTVARWRVVVVEDADRLNDAAANALLKSVEEPPARTVFLLCAPSTDPSDIAITLRSRCRHVYVPTPSPAAVKGVLLSDATLGLNETQAQWAADVSAGHIGRARHLASDEAARTKRATALKLPQLVYEPNALYRFTSELVKKAEEEAASELEKLDQREREELESSLGVGAKGKGAAKAQRGASGRMKELEKEQKNRRTRRTRDSLDLALIDIAGLYRDAMLQAAGAVDGDGVLVGGHQHPDMAATSKELARRNSASAMMSCIDAVMECREVLGYNVRPEVALDAMAGRLQQCCGVA